MPHPLTRRDCVVGLDLGQENDNSALVVVEREITTQFTQNRTDYRWARTDTVRLALVMAERIPLKTPYPDVVRRVASVARGAAILAVDATGVGAGVLGFLRMENLGNCHLMPVIITGGDRERHGDGKWRVPKQDLVAGLTRALQSRELCVAKGVELGKLAEEMRAFGSRRRPTGTEELGGKKDDLVIALCLALWAATQYIQTEKGRLVA